jgi:hypothetical protein
MDSAPAQLAIGTLAMTAIDRTSQKSMTRRAGRRSTKAPAGSPIISHGNHAAAVINETRNALACSTVSWERQENDGDRAAEPADRLARPEDLGGALPPEIRPPFGHHR